MRSIRMLLPVLLLPMLFACATSGPRFAALESKDPAQAIIYVYRPSAWTNMTFVPEIVVDKVRVRILPNGSYYGMAVTEGKHQVHLYIPGFTAVSAAKLDLVRGQRVYLRVDTDYSSDGQTRSRSFTLTQVAEAEALKEIAQTNLAPEGGFSPQVKRAWVGPPPSPGPVRAPSK